MYPHYPQTEKGFVAENYEMSELNNEICERSIANFMVEMIAWRGYMADIMFNL